MRFALRKQDRIKSVLGEDLLNELLSSLNCFLKSSKPIVCKEATDEIKYQSFDIQSIGDKNKKHTFLIIKHTYDVFMISYLKSEVYE